MNSSKETGHAKNVNTCESLLKFCASFGPSYNPFRPEMKLDAAMATLATAQAAMKEYYLATASYTAACSRRLEVREAALRLVTRCQRTLKASRSTSDIDTRAAALVRKIRGVGRAAPDVTVESGAPGSPEVATHRRHHHAHDTCAESMRQYSSLLSTCKEYVPLEPDLTLANLDKQIDAYVASNGEVINEAVSREIIRAKRDDSLYDPQIGLVPLVIDIKNYVCAAYGTGSSEYRHISGLRLYDHS